MVVAEGSLPGDVLYPIKVGVNENVRGAIAVSAKSEAELEARLAGRRLEEAEKLATKEDLSVEITTEIEDNFNAHADRTMARIETLAETDARAAADIASNFETSLLAHERVLVRLALDGGSDLAVLIAPLTSDVRSVISASASVKAKADANVEAEADIDLEASAKARLMEAEASLRSAQRAVSSAGVESENETEGSIESNTQSETEAEGSGGASVRVKSEVQGGANSESETSVESDGSLKVDLY